MLAENYTYSIHLASSWTNETVTLNQIPKSAPVLNQEALWLASSNHSFYAYDGGVSWALDDGNDWYTPPYNQLWEFHPTGDSGRWSEAFIPPSSNFSTLSRVQYATYSSGNGLGFALGGMQTGGTTDSGDDVWYELPGLVIYNMTSSIWYNVSADGLTFYGKTASGAAQYVPSFGPAGLLLYIGGKTGGDSPLGWDSGGVFSTDAVYMYEPISQQWGSQKVSGDHPAQVENLCVVGVEGDNDTYEVRLARVQQLGDVTDFHCQIFLYGGSKVNDPEPATSGAVYVLSLPSFNWQKQSVASNIGRYMHSCNVIGNGQMVVVGGIVGANNIPDPWPQGLGVFDMSAMEWAASYNASAAPYVTPKVTKAYIEQNGRYPSSFSDPVVESWFNKSSKYTGPREGASDCRLLQTESTTVSPASPTASAPGHSHKSDAGAIAGGVVGGIAAVTVIIAAFYFWRRHAKRQKSSCSQTESLEDEKAEAEDTGRVEALERHHRNPLANELKGSEGGVELSAASQAVELTG